MSQHRGQRACGKTDGDGTRLCSCGCGKPPEKGRTRWASKACVHEWKIRNWPAYAKEQVWKRDGGVCATCQVDVKPLQAVWVAALDPRKHVNVWSKQRRAWGKFWDMDHILEVVNGGGQCGLDGLQTLCQPCHKAKTAMLAKERAAARREAKGIRTQLEIKL